MNSQPTAIGVHIYSGAFVLGFREKFKVLGKWEELDAGAETFRINLGHEIPQIISRQGLDGWPIDQHRGRVNVVFANPPCFSADTVVLTENGWEKIGKLVKSRSTDRVWAIGSDGAMGFHRIDGWHDNPYTGDLYAVSLKHGRGGSWGKRPAIATYNHRFLTTRGWVQAASLQQDDLVATGEIAPNARQRELIDGMMLGDATIKARQAQFGTSQTCEELVAMKRDALGDLVCGDGVEPRGMGGDGYFRRPLHGFYCKTLNWAKVERERWYGGDGRKIVPVDVRLTDLALAVWFMDDGHGIGQRWSHRPEYKTRYHGPWLSMATCSFDATSLEILTRGLEAIGITAVQHRRKSGYVDLEIRGESAIAFIDRIGRFVPPSMRYKLPDWAPGFEQDNWQLGASITGWDSPVVVNRGPAPDSFRAYCLDVPEAQNFVTRGGVVHNCAIWSTMGSRLGENDPRIVFTKNCAELAKRLEPDFFVMESVCRAWSPTGGRPTYTRMAQEFGALGYATTIFMTNTMLHGAPQSRERFHFIAHRYAIDLHGPDMRTFRPATVRDAIGDLEESAVSTVSGRDPTLANHVYPVLSPSEMNVVKRMCPGEGWDVGIGRCIEDGVPFRKSRFLAGRMEYDRPSRTMVDISCVFHPARDRIITMREGARLCGYPDWFRFSDSPSNRTYGAEHVELTQAALPFMGRFLGDEFARALDRADGVRPTASADDIKVVDLRPLTARFGPRSLRELQTDDTVA